MAGTNHVQRAGASYVAAHQGLGIHGRISVAHGSRREVYLVGLSCGSVSTQPRTAYRSRLDHRTARLEKRANMDRHGSAYMGKTIRPRARACGIQLEVNSAVFSVISFCAHSLSRLASPALDRFAAFIRCTRSMCVEK